MRSQREVLIRKDPDALSSAAADLFIGIANEAFARHGVFSVSLAGGSTPRNLYSRLSSSEYRSAVDWGNAYFSFGDERNVPPDSPDSNFRMANETLLRPLRIKDRNLLRWPTELEDAELTASRYEDELTRSVPLDLVLLGLGDDAHTASLFPHTSALRETERLAVANWVEKLGEYRFTMTFPALNSSANVIFLVSGEEKAGAVANVLEGEFNPDDYPAQLVGPQDGRLFWLLDEAAASLLKGV